MTVYTHNGHRVMCDGGTDTVTRTVEAKDVVTREVDGDDVEMLRVPISSTRSDREGDRFNKSALEGMAEQIREQQPMVFDNHGLAGSFMEAIPYDSRETIGAQMDAEVEQVDDGEYELFAYINPDGTHSEGERLVKQVSEEKQPIKFSVGFKILDSNSITDDAGNEIGREFTDVDEMETSRVGIPANPDASTPQQMSAKGMTDLPGYKNHPLFQMMQATADDGEGATEAKDGEKVEGGCDSDEDCPDGEVCVEGECIPEEDLSGDDPGDTKQETCPECGADIPDGANYCPQCGEELGDVGDDDDDDDDTEEDSEVPEHVQDMREELTELREEVSEYREAARERGASKTGDTSMEDTTAEYPDETDDSEDSTEQKETDEQAGKPLTEQFK